MMARLTLTIAGIAVLSACAGERSSPTESVGPAMGTDSAVYHARLDERTIRVTIGFRYTNRTDGPVYVGRCRFDHPPSLQKLVEGAWVTAYSPVVLMCWEPPTVIARGATYDGVLHVVMGRAGTNIHPKVEVPPLAGTYRLFWYISGQDPLPERERTSTPFEIRE
ncbi:MAG: hypothetical protein ACRELD_15190 [Longimicrobiales bacterium]